MRLATFLTAATMFAAGPPRTTLHVPYWVEGDPVTSIQATVDGKPARVVRAHGPRHDMMLLVVLDLAGDLALADPAREAVIASINELPANVYAGLLRAQDGLQVLLDPGPDRAKAADTIRSLNISGRAGLLGTVETALQIADAVTAKASVRIAVLYVTDSTIGNYREDYTNPVINSSDSRDMSRRFPEGLIKEKISQLLASISVAEAPLFIVHLNYQNDRLNEAYQTGLVEIAASTGGNAEFCRSVAEIPAAVGSTFQRILAAHTAEIQLPVTKVRQVSLELAAEGRVLKHRQRIAIRR
ncbi:MAG: hypothetical protein FJW39_07910 [Acidobacteria bacterium]|nr:hypothetical protein [Acidobacteriota bacterium]